MALKPLHQRDSNSNEVDYLRKITIVVFGDAGVGKTSLISRFLGNGFNDVYQPTIEDFFIKHVFYKNQTYELQVIDTSGTYEFPAMRQVDIAKADAFVLVYSPERSDSFRRLSRYRSEILEGRKEKYPCIVVCNKGDLPLGTHNPVFKDQRGLQISVQHLVESEWRCCWMACSAKENQQVEDIFLKLMDEMSRAKQTGTTSGRISSLLQLKKRTSSKGSINSIDSAEFKLA